MSVLTGTIGLALCLNWPQAGQLAVAENQAYNAAKPSIVTIQQGGTTRGVAVCIDPNGLFLAHRSATSYSILFGKLPNGMLVQLTVRAVDASTQMALLRAEAPGLPKLTAVALAKEGENPVDSAFVMLPSGAIYTQVVSMDRHGMLEVTKRAVPLIELRFEAPMQKVGGCPIFTQKGELLGFLTATTSTQETNRSQGLPLTTSRLSQNAIPQQFGPSGLTVGYALGPTLMQKIIDGFRSPDAKVVFPAIGIMLADSKMEGVEIREVTELSPADRAGLRVGDRIVRIGERKILTQMDYVRAMLEQKAGEPVEIELMRGEQRFLATVIPQN